MESAAKIFRGRQFVASLVPTIPCDVTRDEAVDAGDVMKILGEPGMRRSAALHRRISIGMAGWICWISRFFSKTGMWRQGP